MIRRLILRLMDRQLRRFARDEEGAAVVEFALILPFLLLLYLGSIEASTLFTVDRRVEVISSTMADLVARWNPNVGPISSANVADYFKASEGIMVPYPVDDLTQVVTFVQVAAGGTAKVVWSCGHNGGQALTKDAPFAVDDKMMMLVTSGKTKSGYLVASTVKYPYLPVFGIVFSQAVPMQSDSLFLPRFGGSLAAPTGGCPT